MAESVVDAAAKGDYRKTLEALRDRLAVELDSAEGRDVAPLAKQLQDVLAAIAKLPSDKERTLADELADRRKARKPGANVSERASAGGGRGRRGGGAGGAGRSGP